MTGLLTYWNTLRHLRPIQFYGRIRFRFIRPHIDLRPAPPLRQLNDKKWVEPVQRNASLVGPHCFCFLNETHNLDDYGWNSPELEKLWRYNLHYFDDLNAQDAMARKEWHRALLSRWVNENPPSIGTGWESYPTSLRIVNWIKWALTGNELPPECVQSLAVQARWLSRRLEFHLLGNHLFANAKALVFAGLFFEGPDAADWLNKGLRILEKEVQEQILPDGGQFERSTMYHALALEDMLDLFNVTSAINCEVLSRWQSTISGWRERSGLMRSWLATMCHPDGEIGFFNDATVGIAPAPSDLEQYSARLGLPNQSISVRDITHLDTSGYIRIEQGDAVALLDVASIGPDYLPGHAHADTLSFELSLFGHRIFVNSGTSCYGKCEERQAQRGTAAHNTVVVTGHDSSEVWADFRVARRASPVGLEVIRDGGFVVQCGHDGYRKLPGKPMHVRRWLLNEGSMIVEDRVTGNSMQATARFHLHPAISLDNKSMDPILASKKILQLPQGKKIIFAVEGGFLRVESSSWHPEFGRSEPNLCLAVDFNGSDIRTHINWAGAN